MRRRSEQTRNDIILAARELFLAKGYVATSMDQIAENSHVTKQTLYGYFTDKRSLFTGVIEAAVGSPWDTQKSFGSITTIDDLEQVLLKMGAHINVVSMNPEYIKLLRVIVSEAATQPELGDLFRRGVTYRALDSLEVLFAQATKKGIITLDDPKNVARLFLGSFVIRIFLDGLLGRPEEIVRQTDAELYAYVHTFVQNVMCKKE